MDYSHQYSNLAVPTAEHFIPLFLALVTSQEAVANVIYRKYELGNLSYLCFKF